MYNIFSSFPLAPREMGGWGRWSLWRAFRAAALQGRLYLFGEGGAIWALKADFPSAALGGGTAESRLTRAWTFHPGDLTGGRACLLAYRRLEQLTDHLALTCQLWEEERRHVRTTKLWEKLIEPEAALFGPQARPVTLNCSREIIYHMTLCSKFCWLVRTWKKKKEFP